MKKLLLIGYILISTSILFALPPDSTQWVEGINTFGGVAEVIVSLVAPKYSAVVIAVTAILSTVASAIFGLFHRKKTIKKWEDSGELKIKKSKKKRDTEIEGVEL